MNVALVLTGQIRSFLEQPSVLDGLRQDGCEIDVFAVYPIGDSGEASFQEFWRADRPGFKLRASLAIQDRQLPEYGYKESKLCYTQPWMKASVVQSVLRQMAMVQVGLSLARQCELLDSSRYDWIIKSRFDLKFDRPIEQLIGLPRELHVPAHNNWSGYNDRLAFGPSEIMERYCYYYSIRLMMATGMEFYPESMLKTYLTGIGIIPQRTRALSYIIRHGVRQGPDWLPEHGDLLEYRETA